MRHPLRTPMSPSASLRTKPTRTSALPGINLLMTQKTRKQLGGRLHRAGVVDGIG